MKISLQSSYKGTRNVIYLNKQTWNRSSQEDTHVGVSLLLKFQGCSFIKKETPIQVVSFKFCKLLIAPFLIEHFRATAFGRLINKKQ